MIQIPVSKNGNSDFDITLDGITYTLRYRYNSRNRRLFFDILQDDLVITLGVRLIEWSFPTTNLALDTLPRGAFFVSPLKDTEEIATLGNFGIDQDYSMIYLSEQEVIDRVGD